MKKKPPENERPDIANELDNGSIIYLSCKTYFSYY